jgi:hypothetical protein
VISPSVAVAARHDFVCFSLPRRLLGADGNREVGAAQSVAGSDAHTLHDRHGLHHRDAQWAYPILGI